MKKIVYLTMFCLFLLNLTSCKFGNKNKETNYLETSDTITVSSNDYYYTFKPKAYSKGIIIFPKDEVDHQDAVQSRD